MKLEHFEPNHDPGIQWSSDSESLQDPARSATGGLSTSIRAIRADKSRGATLDRYGCRVPHGAGKTLLSSEVWSISCSARKPDRIVVASFRSRRAEAQGTAHRSRRPSTFLETNRAARVRVAGADAEVDSDAQQHRGAWTGTWETGPSFSQSLRTGRAAAVRSTSCLRERSFRPVATKSRGSACSILRSGIEAILLVPPGMGWRLTTVAPNGSVRRSVRCSRSWLEGRKAEAFRVRCSTRRCKQLPGSRRRWTVCYLLGLRDWSIPVRSSGIHGADSGRACSKDAPSSAARSA